MKYFLHDTNAFQDEKISELFIEYGYEGLGLFYTALEKIAAQEKPIKTSVLKSQLRVGKKLEKCWSFMESLGILCSNNGETFNKQLLNYAEKYQIKKEKNAKRILQWRENQSSTGNVTHSESVSNAPKVKVSKVKVDKVFTPPTALEVQDYFFNNGYSRESGSKAYEYYRTANWKDSRGKQVKNWRQKMQGNWFKDEYKIQKRGLVL